MSTTRYLTLLGLALGAIFVISGFVDLIIAGLFALVGFVIGLVLEGRINVDMEEAFGRGNRS